MSQCDKRGWRTGFMISAFISLATIVCGWLLSSMGFLRVLPVSEWTLEYRKEYMTIDGGHTVHGRNSIRNYRGQIFKFGPIEIKTFT